MFEPLPFHAMARKKMTSDKYNFLMESTYSIASTFPNSLSFPKSHCIESSASAELQQRPLTSQLSVGLKHNRKSAVFATELIDLLFKHCQRYLLHCKFQLVVLAGVMTLGHFYPAHLESRRWLEYYAGVFDYVEIDSSFYDTATRW